MNNTEFGYAWFACTIVAMIIIFKVWQVSHRTYLENKELNQNALEMENKFLKRELNKNNYQKINIKINYTNEYNKSIKEVIEEFDNHLISIKKIHQRMNKDHETCINMKIYLDDCLIKEEEFVV